MKWILLLMLAALPAFAIEPATPEVDRLRRENAELRKQVAELKAEVAQLKAAAVAAKPPAAKPTHYTPAELAKLIPANLMPTRTGWPKASSDKAAKVLSTVLVGETITLDLSVRDLHEGEQPQGFFSVPVTSGGFIYMVDVRTASPPTVKPGRTVAVTGQIKQVALPFKLDGHDGAVLVMTDCTVK